MANDPIAAVVAVAICLFATCQQLSGARCRDLRQTRGRFVDVEDGQTKKVANQSYVSWFGRMRTKDVLIAETMRRCSGKLTTWFVRDAKGVAARLVSTVTHVTLLLA